MESFYAEHQSYFLSAFCIARDVKCFHPRNVYILGYIHSRFIPDILKFHYKCIYLFIYFILIFFLLTETYVPVSDLERTH